MRFGQIPGLSRSRRTHVQEFKHERLPFLRRILRECGAIGRARFVGREVVFVQTPELAHEILVEKARAFEKSPGTRLSLYPLAGEGLFTSRGDLWRRQRKLIAPLFNPAQIATFAACMTEAANRCAAGLRHGETVEVARATTQIAMTIVGKALFDAETFDEADELGEALTVALEWANSLIGTWPMYAQMSARQRLLGVRNRSPEGPLRTLCDRALGALEMPAFFYFPGQGAMRQAVAKIDSRIDRMITARQAVGLDRRDLLTQLLRAHDDDTDRMTAKQVRDEAVTLFLAGHETTALGLAWAFHELSKSPSLFAAVRQEGDRFAGRPPRPEEFDLFPRSLAVFKEALRMYPPVYVILREAIADVVIGGYELPRGTIVIVSAYGMHHNPDVYPDPERFDPERFTAEAESDRPRAAWLPFGAGPRVCIGNHFALLEGQIVLATLAHHVAFEPIPAVRVRPQPTATLRPAHAMPMRVRRWGAAEVRCAPLAATPLE